MKTEQLQDVIYRLMDMDRALFKKKDAMDAAEYSDASKALRECQTILMGLL